jgi:hypothetical protein
VFVGCWKEHRPSGQVKKNTEAHLTFYDKTNHLAIIIVLLPQKEFIRKET